MKQVLNSEGLWQSVNDKDIKKAKYLVGGDLQLMTINDYYEGRKIEAVTFESLLPEPIRKVLGTNQAVLFKLSKGHLKPKT